MCHLGLPGEVWTFQSHKAAWDRHQGHQVPLTIPCTVHIWLNCHPEVSLCALSASWLTGVKSRWAQLHKAPVSLLTGYMATLNSSLRDGETAQLLGALAVLPEDLVSDSQDPHGGHSHLSLQFRRIQCTLPISVDIRHVCGADIHVRKALIHINNKSCF